MYRKQVMSPSPRLTRLVLPLMVLSWLAAGMASADAAPEPANANWHLLLERVWGVDAKSKENKNLDLFINLVDGRMTAGVGAARFFNRSGHIIQRANVRLTGNTFQIDLEASLYPDRWQPKDGATTPVTATLSGKLSRKGEATTLSGQYTATVGKDKVRGRLSGAIMPRSKATNVRLPGRLFPVKVDGRDFPEMEMQIAIKDEQPTWGRFGMSWHRWPHRWYEFDASGLDWDAQTQKITGTIRVPGRAVDVACEPNLVCDMTFDGAYVANLFAGTVTVKPAKGQPTESFPTRVFNGGDFAWENAAGRELTAEDYCWMYEVDQEPWFAKVKGHTPPKPGEHPRLLFRKSDVKRIRARAATDEGRKIVARLRKLLGHNGEKLPTQFNRVPAGNINRSDSKQPLGVTFTSFHAPGFAMLYQLTGEQKYADLARGAVELMFAVKMDRDNRYGWKQPGTHLRVGTLLGSVALAYDLAYEGWDDAFRRKVALALQNYDHEVASGGQATPDILLGRTGYPPSSNHYGSHFGGTTTAMLAILGDPGTDTKLIEKRIAEGRWMIPQFFHYGMGEGGFYQEGPHPSRLSTNGGLLECLQALKNVKGVDYITPRPNGQFATLRWVMWLWRDGAGRPVFMNRGTYGNDQMYGRAPMLSHSGDFAFGFGAIDEKYKPAVLWTYNNFVHTWEEGEARPWWVDEGENSYTAFVYPHQAVHALVDWPLDIKPQNPAKVLPLHVADKINDYFVSRNRWRDGDDIVVTFSTGGGPWGYHRGKSRGTIIYNAYGTRVSLPPRMGHCKPYGHRVAEDGSFALDLRTYFFEPRTASFVVDLTGRSGAGLVIVYATRDNEPDRLKAAKQNEPRGKAAVQNQLVQCGDTYYYVSTADKETKPQIRADGNAIIVGKSRYVYDGETIVCDVFGGE